MFNKQKKRSIVQHNPFLLKKCAYVQFFFHSCLTSIYNIYNIRDLAIELVIKIVPVTKTTFSLYRKGSPALEPSLNTRR